MVDEDKGDDCVVQEDYTLSSPQVSINALVHDPSYMDVKRVPVVLIFVRMRLLYI